MAAVLAHTICSGGKKRTILSVPRLREMKSQRKPRPGRSARLVCFPNGRTDGRTDDRTIGLLRRRRKRPRHRCHESPTNRQKKKPQKVASFKMLTNDRERSGWWVVAIPSLLVTNDPRSVVTRAARTHHVFRGTDRPIRANDNVALRLRRRQRRKTSSVIHSSFIQPRDGGGVFVVVSPAYPPIGKSFLSRTVRTPRDLLRPETAA